MNDSDAMLFCSRCGPSSKLVMDGKFIRCNHCGQAFEIPREKRGLFSKEPDSIEAVTSGPCPEKVMEYEFKINKLNEKISDLSKQIDYVKKESDFIQNELNNDNSKLKDENQTMCSTISELSEDNDKIKSEKAELESIIEERQSEIKEMKTELEQMKIKIAETQQQKENTESELEQTIENKEILLRTARQEIQILKDELKDRESEIEELRESECTKQDLDDLKEELKTAVAHKNEIIDELESQIDDLEDDLRRIRIENDRLDSINSNQLKTISKLEKKFERLKEEFMKISNRNHDLEIDNKIFENQLSVLNANKDPKKTTDGKTKYTLAEVRKLEQDNEALKKFFQNQCNMTFKKAAAAYFGTTEEAMQKIEEITRKYEKENLELRMEKYERWLNGNDDDSEEIIELSDKIKQLEDTVKSLADEKINLENKLKSNSNANELPVRDIMETMLECIGQLSIIPMDDEDQLKQSFALLNYLKMRMKQYGMEILFHEPGKFWTEGIDKIPPNLFVHYTDSEEEDHTVFRTESVGCVFPPMDPPITPITEKLFINIYEDSDKT